MWKGAVRAVTRIVTYVVLAAIHVSGAPTQPVPPIGETRCLSFARADALGLDVTALRDEYRAAVTVFPERKGELAEAWQELQYTLRDRLREGGLTELEGHSMFTVVFFEPDGRISRVIYRGLDADEEAVFCQVVHRLAEDYRFPLTSEARFSQCGTTHFQGN